MCELITSLRDEDIQRLLMAVASSALVNALSGTFVSFDGISSCVFSRIRGIRHRKSKGCIYGIYRIKTAQISIESREVPLRMWRKH